MLGTLLEFSVGARPAAELLYGYAALGLADVPVADTAPGRYVVVSHDGVAIGLHDAELDAITPTFVRPELKNHIRALRRQGVEFEFLNLADDEFHRAGFRDPSGLMVHLLEARTFPPAEAKAGTVPVCGRLVELSVGASSLDEAAAFWTRLGLSGAEGMSAPHDSLRLSGHGLTLGLHVTSRFGTALTFAADNIAARVEYLRAKGFDVRRGSPLTRSDGESATLLAPGAVQFFIVDSSLCGPR